MYCKKCGKEIREGNIFCTNCGQSINENVKSKKKLIIIIIAVLIVITTLIIGIKVLNNKKRNNQNDSTGNQIIAENTISNNIIQENETVVQNDDIVEEKSLLEQIELIDPNNEYPVCIGEYGDYTEYWILDDEGNKIRFSDIEGFKNAIKIYKESVNKIPDSNDNSDTDKQENLNNNTTEKQPTTNTNNQNINNNPYNEEYMEDNNQDNEEKYENTSVKISYNELQNKTEAELVKLFKEKGLTPKVNKITEEVPYIDERANKIEVTNMQSEYGYQYEEGETVDLELTYYKPVAWTTFVNVSVSGKSFNIGGKTCYITKQDAGRYSAGAYCFYENPLNLDSYWLYGENRGKGVEFYINNKSIGKGSVLWEEYTFDKVETITFKIVVPYAYSFDKDILNGKEGTMIDTDVVVYEKKINVKDLYKSQYENAEIKID